MRAAWLARPNAGTQGRTGGGPYICALAYMCHRLRGSVPGRRPAVEEPGLTAGQARTAGPPGIVNHDGAQEGPAICPRMVWTTGSPGPCSLVLQADSLIGLGIVDLCPRLNRFCMHPLGNIIPGGWACPHCSSSHCCNARPHHDSRAEGNISLPACTEISRAGPGGCVARDD